MAKYLELTIGRDATTGKLRMSNGKQAQLFGEKESVPKSVSREHVSISVTEMGEIILKNLNVENDTYVNGKGIEQKVIKQGDKIELGNERWVLSWKEYLDAVLPKFVDIRSLEQVWEEYKSNHLKMQIKERRFNAIRSATGILTLGAMALSLNGFLGKENPIYGYLYIAAAIVTALGFIWSYRLASKIPLENARNQEEAEKKYKCPQCEKLFPLQKYEQLKQQGKCMHCKAIFIS